MDAPEPPAAPAAPPAGGWTEPGADVPWSAAVRGPRAPHRLPRERSASWAGLLGWLLPGFGQVYLGRVGAGLVLLLVISATFAGGLALTDFSCVDPRTYQLEFVAHGLIGGPTALAIALTENVRLARMPPWLEVGRLYVVVAGFLNLVAICDALGECWRRNARIQALRSRLAVRAAGPVSGEAASRLPEEVAIASPPPAAGPASFAPELVAPEPPPTEWPAALLTAALPTAPLLPETLPVAPPPFATLPPAPEPLAPAPAPPPPPEANPQPPPGGAP